MNLTKDIQRKIALELSPVDLINFCVTNKTFNASICNSKEFWIQKLEIDYPEELLPIYQGKKIDNPKSIYIKRFTEISNEIEKIIPMFIEDVFGLVSKFLKEEYKTELFKILFNTYLRLKELNEKNIEDIDEYNDERSDIILDLNDINIVPERVNIYSEEYDDLNIILDGLWDRLKVIDLKNFSKIKELKRLKDPKLIEDDLDDDIRRCANCGTKTEDKDLCKKCEPYRSMIKERLDKELEEYFK